MLSTLFASSAMIEVGWRFFSKNLCTKRMKELWLWDSLCNLQRLLLLQVCKNCHRVRGGPVEYLQIKILKEQYIDSPLESITYIDLSWSCRTWIFPWRLWIQAQRTGLDHERIWIWNAPDWTQRAKEKRHHAAMLLGSNRHDFDRTNICWSIPYRLIASYSENSKTVCDSEDVFCGWLRGLTAEFMLSNFIHFLHSTPSLRCNIHHDQRAGWGLDLGCDDGGHTFAIFSSRKAWDWN